MVYSASLRLLDRQKIRQIPKDDTDGLRGRCLETWGEIRLRACYPEEVLHGEDSLRLASMPANSPRTSLR
jgi:hypothetical protein